MKPVSGQISHVYLHDPTKSHTCCKLKCSFCAFYTDVFTEHFRMGEVLSRFVVARIIAFVAHMVFSVPTPYTYIRGWKHLSGLVKKCYHVPHPWCNSVQTVCLMWVALLQVIFWCNNLLVSLDVFPSDSFLLL